MSTRSRLILALLVLVLAAALGLVLNARPVQAPTHSPTASATVGAVPPSPSPTPSSTVPATRPPSITPSPAPTVVAGAVAEEALARATVPARDRIDLARRFQPNGAAATATPSPWPKVGDREAFFVVAGMQDAYTTVTATLRVVSDHLYMWVQDGYEVALEALQASAKRFDSVTWPTSLRVFGSDWADKLSEPRISVFNGHVAGAFFYSSDEFPRSVSPYSNEREIVYVSLDSWRPGTGAYDATLAHELQHLIHFHYDSHEDGWVNEGLAELAKEVNGFPPEAQSAFQQRPDTQLNDWDGSAAHYGQSYALMSYLLDRFGEAFIGELVADPATGLDSLDGLLGKRGVRFDDVYADWVVANLMNDPELEGGRFGYRETAMPSPSIATRITQGQSIVSETVYPYATDYIAIDATVPVTLEFRGVVTVPVAPMIPHSGRYAWWSSRGDSSDMTLTRAIDLREVSSATLNAWLWYDIEEDWDYAYVAVSSDGGQTWTALAGPHTRTTDPHGNSLGPALTGRSGQTAGGQGQPSWVQGSFDLSQFTGKEVLVRFEYVTDDEVNLDGLWIDDIEIPELGWTDDAEAPGEWTAQGFVRIPNELAQRFLVQVIERGAATSVRRIPVGPEGRAVVEVGGAGTGVSDAVIAVSGLTRWTRQSGPYDLHILREGQ